MEITSQLEQDDYWQFNKFVISRVPELKRKIILNLVVPVLIWLGAFWFFHFPLVVYVVLNLALCVCWPFYYFPEMKRATIKRAEMVPGSFSQYTLTISPEQLRQVTAMSESTIGWSSFTELTENSHYLLFFLSERYALIIPKRAFPSAEQSRAFLETAQAYRISALNGTTPVLPPSPQTWPPAPQRIL